eukprot:3873849-Amphidinium_carterae.1
MPSLSAPCERNWIAIAKMIHFMRSPQVHLIGQVGKLNRTIRNWQGGASEMVHRSAVHGM